jgi:hypothetical protein
MKTLKQLRDDFLAAIEVFIKPSTAIGDEVIRQSNIFMDAITEEACRVIDEEKKRCDERIEDTLGRLGKAINNFIEGQPIEPDGPYMAEKLAEFRRTQEATLIPSKGGLPPMRITQGSSGLQLEMLLKASHNCVEFSTRENTFQPLFISPWIQFEPTELHELRAKYAMEVARRAASYDSLLDRIASLESVIESFHRGDDRRHEDRTQLIEQWRSERVKYGLPADFSDLNESKA